MAKAYYSNEIDGFLQDDTERILGILAEHHYFSLEERQKNAWLAQIQILKDKLSAISKGYILLEYSIPRMGKRIDTVLLSSGIVFVIEFKVGEEQYGADALDQVLDYALDLKNFHEQSQDKSIVPILIATEAPTIQNSLVSYDDKVYKPIRANKQNLDQVVCEVIHQLTRSEFSPVSWRDSIYKPTPTIIEAAQALYQGHRVEEISRSDAGAINLSRTSRKIFQIIDEAKTNSYKSICFVTGVPGAGKTLAGLNIANERLKTNENEHAVFLSGNGPLVKVLREALARDEVKNSVGSDYVFTKKKSLSKAQTFIQNIHHFRDEALDSNRPPHEKVVIFDEAQRAWTQEQTASFMKMKRGKPNFSMSEPQFLISVMDRHLDWAVIVCLVGGGQEINTGEAGLLEWFSAIREHFPHWQVYSAGNLADSEYTRGADLLELIDPGKLNLHSDLHLSVSVRSFRSEKVAALVKSLLDNDLNSAKKLYQEVGPQYPIVITHDVEQAKEWVKAKARGTERYGLLASSGGKRLRAIGINVQAEVDVINWFLNGKQDVRSSYYLEEVATEFDVQGLELDWTCVAWDADFRYSNGDWEYKAFQGTKWQNIKGIERKLYLKNAYRVLLTRARQGMVIVIPDGSDDDPTRVSSFYAETYHYLKQIGFEEI